MGVEQGGAALRAERPDTCRTPPPPFTRAAGIEVKRATGRKRLSQRSEFGGSAGEGMGRDLLEVALNLLLAYAQLNAAHRHAEGHAHDPRSTPLQPDGCDGAEMSGDSGARGGEPRLATCRCSHRFSRCSAAAAPPRGQGALRDMREGSLCGRASWRWDDGREDAARKKTPTGALAFCAGRGFGISGPKGDGAHVSWFPPKGFSRWSSEDDQIQKSKMSEWLKRPIKFQSRI